jgi:SAM-dependent methyltransferase
MYATIRERLQAAYDRSVDEREANATQDWKKRVRSDFLALLQSQRKSTILEVGAGTGVHGLHFQEAGLDVFCTDLSPAMVERCRSKGLRARQADFLSVGSIGTFDAIFSMNCFLHVPPDRLCDVLCAMRKSLADGGLLYWGQYGGTSHTGTLETDQYEPKRYFSMLTDDELLSAGERVFELVSFESIVVDRHWDQRFQSSIWQRADDV